MIRGNLLVLRFERTGELSPRPHTNRQRPFGRTRRKDFCYMKGDGVLLKRSCSNYETGLTASPRPF